MEIVIDSLEALDDFAKNFASTLNIGDCVLLSGDLGAGKTTLVKSLAKYLGYTGMVTSPTFTLVNEYSGYMPIYHFDLYRLKSSNEAIDAGLDEIIAGKDGICFIEWPEKAPQILPSKSIKVDIGILDENTRKIKVVE